MKKIICQKGLERGAEGKNLFQEVFPSECRFFDHFPSILEAQRLAQTGEGLVPAQNLHHLEQAGLKVRPVRATRMGCARSLNFTSYSSR